MFNTTKKRIVVIFRLLLALLTLVAIAAQFTHASQHTNLSLPAFFVRMFSYFTNLVNMLAAIVFIGSTIALIKVRPPSVMEDLCRTGSALYMAVAGSAFLLLLAGTDDAGGIMLPWVNIQLHYIMPVAVVLDWVVQPQRTPLSIQHLLSWLLFPAIFFVFTLLRGSRIHWYPYPFLDPAVTGGYRGIALFGVGFLAVLILVGIIMIKWGNRTPSHAGAKY